MVNSHVISIRECAVTRVRRTHTRDDRRTTVRVSALCTSLPASVFPSVWAVREEPVEKPQWQLQH